MNTIIKNVAGNFRTWKPAYFILVALLMASSCKEDEIGQQPTDGVPPRGLTSAEAIPRPGGALIAYVVPDNDTDISYVKGEYEVNGETRITRSSVYKNFFIIEGLETNVTVTVNLYVVDHSENMSEPTPVTFTTREAPFATIGNTIKINPAIGGVYLMWENPDKRSDIGVVLMTYDTAYKRMSDYAVSFAYNGIVFYPFPTLDANGNKLPPLDFAAYVLDKWGHYSDTSYFNVAPVTEVWLNRRNMDGHPIGDDARLDNPGTAGYNAAYYSGPSRLFDSVARALGFTGGLSATGFGIISEDFDANTVGTLPVYYTIDLGVEAIISRYWMPHRDHDTRGRYLYGSDVGSRRPCSPYHWKMWGTTTDFGDTLSANFRPKDDPYWKQNEWKQDSRWVYMGEYFSRRPLYPNASPQDPGPYSGDTWSSEQNMVYASPSQSHPFTYFISEMGIDKVRYIRFEFIESWAASWAPGSSLFYFHELWLWGGIVENDSE
jgi:hypothetical protein